MKNLWNGILYFTGLFILVYLLCTTFGGVRLIMPYAAGILFFLPGGPAHSIYAMIKERDNPLHRKWFLISLLVWVILLVIILYFRIRYEADLIQRLNLLH